MTRLNPFTATRPSAPPATESRHIVERFDRSLIRRDGGTQMRLGINRMKAQEYAELKAHGHRFDPIRLFYDGTDYWLADGFHREAADDINGETHTRAEINPGTRRDAILYAASEANSKHGLPPSLADRQNAATVLLQDEEWSQWSDREIGRRVGLSHPTIGKMRAKLAEATGKSYQSERIGADGRTINVAPIGENQPARPKPSTASNTASNGAAFEQATQSPNHPITQKEPIPLSQAIDEYQRNNPEETREWQRLQAAHNALSNARIAIEGHLQTFDDYAFGQEAERILNQIFDLREEIAQLTPKDRT